MISHTRKIRLLRRAVLTFLWLSPFATITEGVSEETHGWEEGAPLPEGAIKAISEMRLSSSPFDTRYSEMTLSGQELGTLARSLEADLKKLQEESKGIRVEEDELELRIIFDSDILFDFDKAAIRPDAEASLSALTAVLKSFKDKTIRIIGHTDNKGSHKYNEALSRRRADSVSAWLVRQSELHGFRFESMGRGESQPIANNALPDGRDDPDGRQKNRRVEIEIPKT